MQDATTDLTRRQAEQELGVTKLTMLRLIGRGEFPNAYQVGGRGDWRIPSKDIDAYKQRGRIAVTT